MSTPLTVTSKIRNALRIDRALSFVWMASRKWTIISFILVAVQGIIPLFSLYLIKLIIDTITAVVQGGGAAVDPAGRIMLLIALAGIVALVQVGADRLASYAAEAQSVAVTDYVYSVLHKKSIDLDLAYYENPAFYDTLHRAQAEGPYRPTSIVGGLNRVGQSGVSLAVMAGLLFTFHWSVGMLLFVSTLPGLWVQIAFARRNFRWQQEITPSERRAAYYNWVLTSDSHAKEIRLFGLGSYFADAFDRLRAMIRGEKLDLARKRSLGEFLAQGFSVLILMSCFLLIALRTVKGLITIGDLVMYFSAFQRGVGNLRDLLQNLARLYEDNLFVSQFFSFLDAENRVIEHPRPKPLPQVAAPEITLDAISFRYPGHKGHVLTDISFSIAPGEVIALVGANGAGKSTIVKLLCRLYDPSGGTVSYNRIPYPEISLAELRSRISVVFQDFVQYLLSVADNIRTGDISRQTRDPGALLDAAQKAGITGLVENLPQGYDTMLGKWFEAGEELSIGEWQKLVIARAFYRDADFIILDEPSSALDADSEHQLFLNFRKLIAGKSALIISHRFSTVRMADRILVLEGGRIIENGSHDELIARQGRYAEMFRKQSSWLS